MRVVGGGLDVSEMYGEMKDSDFSAVIIRYQIVLNINPVLKYIHNIDVD